MQGIASLQHEKAEADVVASSSEDQCEAAHKKDVNAETTAVELEEQLQVESAEADNLHLSTVQQREVGSRSYSLNRPTVMTWQVGFSSVRTCVVQAHAMSVLVTPTRFLSAAFYPAPCPSSFSLAPPLHVLSTLFTTPLPSPPPIPLPPHVTNAAERHELVINDAYGRVSASCFFS